ESLHREGRRRAKPGDRMETLTRCYRYRYVLFPLRNTADREFDCGSISFFRLPAHRLRLSSPGCADQGSATWKRRCETFKASAGRGWFKMGKNKEDFLLVFKRKNDGLLTFF